MTTKSHQPFREMASHSCSMERQGLKPFYSRFLNVAAEAATHKDYLAEAATHDYLADAATHKDYL